MTSLPSRANAPAQYQTPVGRYQTLPDAGNSHTDGNGALVPLSSGAELDTVLTHFKTEIFSGISDTALVGSVLKTIQRWTGKDPLLTRLVCHHVLAKAVQVKEGNEVDLVNTIVQQTVLDHWETNDAGAYLRSLQDRLLAYGQRDSLLILYIQVLQRGAIADTYTPEQAVLLESGLVVLEGGELRIANAIYAAVFDLDWVEAQLPGITRPVMIVRSQAESAHPSSLSKKYSKITVLACGLAVLAAASSMYLKEAGEQPIKGQRAIATETPGPVAAVAAPETRSVLVEEAASDAVRNPVAPSKVLTTDRTLFDNGIDHATNGRWLPMLRDFCAIPAESTYFMPAERQISRWWRLYPEDLLVATETFVAEGGSRCPVVEASGLGQ